MQLGAPRYKTNACCHIGGEPAGTGEGEVGEDRLPVGVALALPWTGEGEAQPVGVALAPRLVAFISRLRPGDTAPPAPGRKPGDIAPLFAERFQAGEEAPRVVAAPLAW